MMIDQLFVKKYGPKAASLLYLQELGLFQKKMFLVPSLISEEEFYSTMKKHGFTDTPFGIRFSPQQAMLGVKSKHKITSWKEGYYFLKAHLYQGTAIIQEHTDPEFMGTLYFGTEKAVINLVPGTWATSAWDCCDIIEIIGDQIDYYRYTLEREALYGNSEGFFPKKVKALSPAKIKRLVKVLQRLWPSLELLRVKGRMLEFILDKKLQFLGMELKESAGEVPLFAEGFVDGVNGGVKGLFTINHFGDFQQWDQKQDLLIALKLGRNIPAEFIHMLGKIKKYKSSVYVKYGLLSHPAILIREQGLETKQYAQHYEKLVFDKIADRITPKMTVRKENL